MKSLSKILLGTAVIAAAVSLSTQQVQGTPLPPGSSNLPVTPGSVASGASLIASNVNVGFAIGGLDGMLSSYVYSGDANNPYGGLTFVYEVTNNGAGTNPIEKLSAGNFAPYLVSVVQDATGGTVASSGADRSDGIDMGDTVSFNFTMLVNGQSSYFLIVQTNASNYVADTVGVIDSKSANVLSFLPTGPAVPDGGSAVALLGIALGGIELLRRKLRIA